MLPSTSLRDSPIPPPPASEPPLTPEAADRIHAALRNLLWLAVYVAVMRLFGYRFRRVRAARPAATRAAATRPAPSPHPTAAPPQPRRQHRYLDRAAAIAQLASINAAVAQSPAESLAQPRVQPAPAAQPAQPLRSPPSRTPPARRAAHAASPAPRHPQPAIAIPPAPPPRLHPPPWQNTTPGAPRPRTPISLRYRNNLPYPAASGSPAVR